MIATAIFGEDGGVYDQSLILNEGFDIDQGLLSAVGLPKLATSALWTSITANIAVRPPLTPLSRTAYHDGEPTQSGSLTTYAVFSLGWNAFWPFETSKSDKPLEDSTTRSQGDNIPGWWHTVLFFLSLFAGNPTKGSGHQPRLTPSTSIQDLPSYFGSICMDRTRASL